MAIISDTDIARVREATDLVSLISERVLLKQKGRLFWGNCPFHDEKTPSFKVDPDTQLFHCFGCGAGGDAFGYLMRSEQLAFPEAVTELAERAHIELDLSKGDIKKKSQSAALREVCEKTTEFYNTYLRRSRSPFADSARKYLGTRGFSLDDAIEWKLGAAPGNGELVAYLRSKGIADEHMVAANVAVRSSGGLKDRFFNRVMFPVADAQGRVIAFGGRILGEGMPKYLNSSETPIFHKSSSMYGIDKAKASITKTGIALVVEGYTDVIALHKSGFTNAVATLGTALSSSHVKLLSRYAKRIVYVFDGDEAGQKAAERAVEFIDTTITTEGSSNPVVLDVIVLPGGDDPANIMDREDGPTFFSEQIASARSLISFAIDRRLGHWDLNRPEERARAINDAVKVLIPIKGTTMASDYAQYIVDKLWSAGIPLDQQQVLASLEREAQNVRKYERPSTSVEEFEEHQLENIFAPHAQQTPIERLSGEIVTFMLSKANARESLSRLLSSGDFAKPYGEVFESLSNSKATQSAQLVSELMQKFKGIEQLFASFNFDDLDEEDIELTALILASRLKEMQLETRIFELGKKLEASSKTEERQKMVAEIRDAQLKLNELRTERHF